MGRKDDYEEAAEFLRDFLCGWCLQGGTITPEGTVQAQHLPACLYSGVVEEPERETITVAERVAMHW